MKLLIIFLTIFFLYFILKRKNNYSVDKREKYFEYYSYKSQIRDWNSYLKVFYPIILIFLSVGLNNILVSLFIFLITNYITIYLGKIPIKRYIDSWKIPFLFLIFTIIVININISKEKIGDYNFYFLNNYIYFTKEKLYESIEIFFRVLSGISSMYMLIYSTSIEEIIKVLRKIKMPDIIIEIMYLTYRYIFILLNTYYEMRVAIESRLGFINYKLSLNSFGKIISNIFLISFRKSIVFYEAMEARNYNGKLIFFERKEKFQKKIFICMLLSIVFLILVFIFEKNRWN
ncbi:cobalt ECF transporter T component CbiQ [Fusobacterium perfoetens]|uniref:cobalt ECF transporter T component CbiQ n=1 Tax=Fusobacterium perfoetens TaxID=852 RepID=UPI000482FC46|nr:cobalt ECF transporter T component CbiQ [Fusobacterium perfoetens]MCI6152793.1 cobalt ECF transporter T component CbiQ [Fusobacterium perfoetens]MDY3236687.1 cobalt ECF transporter T component CbiQ [Fusobacterium perfoetens]